MSTLDWPESLVPQTAQMALRKAGVQFSSPFNGTPQAVDFVAERWTMSASLATMRQRDPRGVRSFLNQLAGGVNRVRVWDFGGGGVPRGTLRGTPRVAVAAARGDTTITIKEATAFPNLIAGGSFELDTNADGLADGMVAYSAGATGSVTFSRVATGAVHMANAQRVTAAALGTSSSDQVGVRLGTVPVVAGQVYTLSIYALGTAGKTRLYIDWLDGGMLVTGLSLNVTLDTPTSGSARLSATGTAAAGAVWARCYAWIEQSPVLGVAQVNFDAAQLEMALAPTSYAGNATLRADDMIAAGGQLFQVAADCTADDSGRIVVPLVNRVRATIAVDSAVTWSRPTCEMMMPAMQSGPIVRPGAIEGAGVDLVEVW